MHNRLLKFLFIPFVLIALSGFVMASVSPAETAAAVAQQMFTPTQTETPSPTPTQKTYTPTLFATAEKGYTNSNAYVRHEPIDAAEVLRTEPANKNFDLYGTIDGDIFFDNISTWFLISAPGQPAEYIYGGMITKGSYVAPAGPGVNPNDNPNGNGKEIIISLSRQQMDIYDNGSLVKIMLVSTGQPGLATPTGTYHVFAKKSPTEFISPFPKSSPYYYEPTYINYALQFYSEYYIHDATWRSVFGPGTNDWHNDPQFGHITGSHGCVNASLYEMSWLYSWAPVGTTVKVMN